MNQNVQQLHELLKRSSHIVFFGGAGVSTASNIPDFRSDEGLYSGKEQKKYPYPPETMLSHTFFVRHTEQFFEYYFDKMVYPDAKPNPAHIALAKLEEMGRLSAHSRPLSRQMLMSSSRLGLRSDSFPMARVSRVIW